MKKYTYDLLTDFENLYKAHRECRKGKRWKDAPALYDMRALESTLYLQMLLVSRRYKMAHYNCFQINERGKTRDIKSIKYQDRVVQRCLNDEIIAPAVMPKFIKSNTASQPGKGQEEAMRIFKEDLQREIRKNGVDGYILVCDMSKYFDSIPHDFLDSLYDRFFDDKEIVEFIRYIHATIPGGVGCPLGNHLSQIDALLALNELDHIIKEQFHIEGYGRYMDDFYLISHDKEELKRALSFIKEYVTSKGLKLNEKKTLITTMRQGVTFIGFKFYVTQTGKVVIRLAKKSIVRHKKKMKKMKGLLDKGEITFEDCLMAHQGWKAHAGWRSENTRNSGKKRVTPNTYYLLRKMDQWFDDLFSEYIPKKEVKNGTDTQ